MSTKERVIHTPVNEADLEDLSIGDIIYLTGALFTMRDLSHKRIGEYVRKGQKLPVDLKCCCLPLRADYEEDRP